MNNIWGAGTIKNLRVSRRQTQAEFAQDLLTDRNTIIRWEAGKSVPGMKNQRKLDELAG